MMDAFNPRTAMAVVVAALVGVVSAAGAAAAVAPVPAPLNQGLRGLDVATLFPGAVFDPAVPGLRAVTGVEPAGRPLRPEEALAWFRALDEASPCATLIEFGRTFEDRPLVLLAVSDPATIADLEGFRRAHVAQLDPRLAPASAGSPAATKAVAMLACGIHGDELSSTDAACALAWWLVVGTDELAAALRRDLVILIEPFENPDGRARYLAQTTSFAHQVANPDQDDLSHAGAWPWGRGNHYLFDLNREWCFTRPRTAGAAMSCGSITTAVSRKRSPVACRASRRLVRGCMFRSSILYARQLHRLTGRSVSRFLPGGASTATLPWAMPTMGRISCSREVA